MAYVAQDNPSAAIRFEEEIEQQVRQLLEHPLMGRSGRSPDTRELVLGRTPFIAIYRISQSLIEILRILHGAQQWPRPGGSTQLD